MTYEEWQTARAAALNTYNLAKQRILLEYQAANHAIDTQYRSPAKQAADGRRAFRAAREQETYEGKRDKLKAKESELLSCVNFYKGQIRAGFEYSKQLATYSAELAAVREKLTRLVNPQNFSEKPLDGNADAADTNTTEQ